MRVTYIDHSGFLVETESAVFLFDYYKGKLPAFPAHKPLFIFASHKHPDHFSFKIFDLYGHPGEVAYIFGNDIKLSERYLQRHNIDPTVKEKIHRMSPHTELGLPLQGDKGNRGEAVLIHTLKSTDAGAAFYVREGNIRIYHGGDLNWWHWKGESESFNKGQETLYKAEINYLKELLEKEEENEKKAENEKTVENKKKEGTENKLDAAFIPLDPRLEEAYSYGMDYFLSRIPVKEVFPMHMWGDYEVIDRYLESEAGKEYAKHIFFTKPS